MNFGYPYCHAGSVADPEYGRKHPCSDFVAPAQALGAHVAALGMRFYTGTQFPAAYRNQIFIAEHGSWNRSAKDRLPGHAGPAGRRKGGFLRAVRDRVAAGTGGVGPTG